MWGIGVEGLRGRFEILDGGQGLTLEFWGSGFRPGMWRLGLGMRLSSRLALRARGYLGLAIQPFLTSWDVRQHFSEHMAPSVSGYRLGLEARS